MIWSADADFFSFLFSFFPVELEERNEKRETAKKTAKIRQKNGRKNAQNGVKYEKTALHIFQILLL